MLARLEELPVKYADRVRIWGIIPFLALSIAAALLLPSLKMNTEIHQAPQRKDTYFDEMVEMQSEYSLTTKPHLFTFLLCPSALKSCL